MEVNFVKRVLDAGGIIRPLLVPAEYTEGTGLCNPSVYIDGDRILVNLRHVQYNLYHNEGRKEFHSRWGPMTYMHPEDDLKLRTINYLCILDQELNLVRGSKVDTSRLDVTPVWDFVGLEDARVVRWDSKLYLIGVRRDTKTNGEGRMEFSEIVEHEDGVRELSRTRIEPPNDPNSYCEKNWMPIINQPFRFVKWSNPTEVVEVDLATKSSKIIHRGQNYLQGYRDFRGGSQVIPWKDGYIAVTHEVDLWHNEVGNKDCHYYHRFLVWDKDWNLVKISKEFKYLTGHVEFTCGIAEYQGDILITFGFQDNAAYILRTPIKVIEDFLNGH